MPSQNLPHCQRCGAEPGEPDPYEPGRPILVAVDWEPLDDQGSIYPRYVCSLCSEGARNLVLERPSADDLLIQIRRASAADQFKVLGWLRTKFPDH